MQAFTLMIGPAGFMVVLQPAIFWWRFTWCSYNWTVYFVISHFHMEPLNYVYVPYREWVSKQVSKACFFFLRPVCEWPSCTSVPWRSHTAAPASDQTWKRGELSLPALRIENTSIRCNYPWSENIPCTFPFSDAFAYHIKGSFSLPSRLYCWKEVFLLQGIRKYIPRLLRIHFCLLGIKAQEQIQLDLNEKHCYKAESTYSSFSSIEYIPTAGDLMGLL